MATSKRFVAKNGLDNNNQTITNVATPSNASDAATRAFAENASNLVSGTLSAARLPAFTGDATSTAGSSALTLANSGVTAGTYRSVTVDVKGRVTAGTNPTTLSGYGITDALSNSTTSTQSGYFGDIFLYDDSTPSHYLGITNSANLTAARTLSLNVNDADRTISLSGNLTVSAAATISGTNTGDQTITLTGDVTGSGTGSFATTLANSGVAAGTYTKVTVDVKGRVTAGTTLASADLPTYTGTLTSGQVTTALGYTPIASSGSITGSSRYVAFLDTRAVDDQPQGKQGYSLSADFKNNTAVSSPPVTSTGTYSHILTIAGWDTAGGSGGWPSQLSVADGIAVRQATSATVWGPWRTVLHSNNYNTYAPTLTGTGASGTWGISITGNAATVTNGVVTTGSYANPAWITSLDAAKLTGTVAMARLTTTGSGQALMLSSGRLANAANLNDYRESGVWGTDATVTTGPAANSYDTLLVLRNSDVGAQIHVPRDPTARRISVRGWSNSGSTWTNWVQLVDTAGSGATGTWGISVTGSAATLTTARTLTIGATGKTFDGSGNVSWTLAELGALALTGGTLTGALEIAVATGNNTKLAYIRGTTGTGVRLGTEGTVSVVEGVDGTNGVTSFQPLAVGGSTVTVRTGGTARLQAKANGQTRFVPLASDPAGQEAGDVYYNSTDNALKFYNGTTWSAVGTGSGGVDNAELLFWAGV